MKKKKNKFNRVMLVGFVKNDNEKARGHSHVTRKFRGTAQWDCNINLQLTKKFL